MRTYLRSVFLVGALGGLAVIMGCGGGSSSGPEQFGRVTLSITWPPREEMATRLVPVASNSIRVQVLVEQTVVAEALLVRPDSPPWTTEVTLEDVPVSPDAVLEASAYPQEDGTGAAQAIGEVRIVVPAGAVAYPLDGHPGDEIHLVMGSTITEIVVEPDPASVQVGETVQLSATCRNSDGAIVLIREAETLTWSVTAGAAYASVDNSGVVTGTAEGTATVTATEQESGVAGSAEISVTALSVTTDWPMFQHDVHHTGYAPQTPTLPFTLDWEFETGSWVDMTPTAADGVLYVGSSDVPADRRVYALSARDGQALWSFQYSGGGGMYCAPAVSEGGVFFGAGDSCFYSLDALTGSLNWRFNAGWEVVSQPVVFDGLVYFGSWDRRLYALDVASGREAWHHTFSASSGYAPVIWQDLVICPGAEGRELCALQRETGSVVWDDTTSKPGFTSAVITENGRLFLGHGRALEARRPETGAVLGAIPGIMYARCCATSGDVIVTVGDDGVYAVDAETLEVIWSNKALGDRTAPGSPIITGDVIWVTAFDSKLVALDLDTGSELQRSDFDVNAQCGATYADAHIFVGSHDRRVYAFRAQVRRATSNQRTRETRGSG